MKINLSINFQSLHEPWAFLVGSKNGIQYNGLLKINPPEMGNMSFPHISPPKQTNKPTNKQASKQQTKTCFLSLLNFDCMKDKSYPVCPTVGLHASTDLIKVQIFDQMNHLRQGREINNMRKTMHLCPSEFFADQTNTSLRWG